METTPTAVYWRLKFRLVLRNWFLGARIIAETIRCRDSTAQFSLDASGSPFWNRSESVDDEVQLINLKLQRHQSVRQVKAPIWTPEKIRCRFQKYPVRQTDRADSIWKHGRWVSYYESSPAQTHSVKLTEKWISKANKKTNSSIIVTRLVLAICVSVESKYGVFYALNLSCSRSERNLKSKYNMVGITQLLYDDDWFRLVLVFGTPYVESVGII